MTICYETENWTEGESQIYFDINGATLGPFSSSSFDAIHKHEKKQNSELHI